MDPERKRIADNVRLAWEDAAGQYDDDAAVADNFLFAILLKRFELAVREDERWELMARSEASPT
jgi:hypothetical protein